MAKKTWKVEEWKRRQNGRGRKRRWKLGWQVGAERWEPKKLAAIARLSLFLNTKTICLVWSLFHVHVALINSSNKNETTLYSLHLCSLFLTKSVIHQTSLSSVQRWLCLCSHDSNMSLKENEWEQAFLTLRWALKISTLNPKNEKCQLFKDFFKHII